MGARRDLLLRASQSGRDPLAAYARRLRALGSVGVALAEARRRILASAHDPDAVRLLDGTLRCASVRIDEVLEAKRDLEAFLRAELDPDESPA